MDNQDLKIADISKKINEITQNVIIEFNKNEKYKKYSEYIINHLSELQKQDLIKVTFIGQYSAGKSTIISALTGIRDIKIDADVATDCATAYNWNNILLIDSPGLNADREDHDKKTYEAIENSDLLVFTITSDLFDNIILSNFIKLAYEKGYKDKILLVLNKMSMESGDFDELKNNYLETLQKSFLSEKINSGISDFKIVFIDAADYIEGKDCNENDLIELSRFDNLISKLNEFVNEKGILGKLDTPIRAIISEIEKSIIENDVGEEDKKFFSVLERIEKKLKRNQDETEISVKKILIEAKNKIINKGNYIANLIGAPESKEQFENEIKSAEVFISEINGNVIKEIENALSLKRNELSKEVEDVFKSDIGEVYFESINKKEISLENPKLNDNSSIMNNFRTINGIAEKITGGVLKMYNSPKITGGLMSSSKVAGSQAHNAVKTVGKFVGYKFKPWEAAKMAKNVGNVAKVGGTILGVISAIIEIKGMYDENQNIKKLVNSRNECCTEFKMIAHDIEKQIMNQFEEYKKEFYLSTLDRISERRDTSILEYNIKSEFKEKIIEQKHKLKKLLEQIYQ